MKIDSVKLSQELIRCPSVTPMEAGVIKLIEKTLSKLSFKCHYLKFTQAGTAPVDNVYARLGDGSPNLCFAGHTDVVPVGDLEGWNVDPFKAVIKDGMLIGRGAADMKSAIAAWITAVSEVKDQVIKAKGSLSLLITNDEEDVSINGTKKVLEWLKEKNEKIDACVVGEPTNPDQLGDMIKIGRRGSMNFTLTVNGVQGHTAYPQFADNPVTKLIKMLDNLTSNKLDKGNEYFQPSNLEITSVDVGNKVTNVIPAKAVAKFNVRFNNIYTREKLIKWVRDHCDKVTTQYILHNEEGSESFLTQPGFLSKTVFEAVKAVTGKSPELSTTGGTSDARFIKDYCPVVEFGLINKTAHKVDEQVRVDDITKLVEVYKQVILRYFHLD